MDQVEGGVVGTVGQEYGEQGGALTVEDLKQE